MTDLKTQVVNIYKYITNNTPTLTDKQLEEKIKEDFKYISERYPHIIKICIKQKTKVNLTRILKLIDLSIYTEKTGISDPKTIDDIYYYNEIQRVSPGLSPKEYDEMFRKYKKLTDMDKAKQMMKNMPNAQNILSKEIIDQVRNIKNQNKK